MASAAHLSRKALAIILSLALVFSVPIPHAFADELSLQAADVSSTETVTPDQTVSVAYAGVGISARAKVAGAGWQTAVASNVVAGDVAGNGVTSLRLELTGLQGISGHVLYQTYKRNVGWLTQKTDGAATPTARNVEAVKIKLTGEVSKHYDVLYRTYVSGQGWRPWVKNGSASGITGNKVRVSAVQVKLSAKTLEAASANNTTSSEGMRYEGRLNTTGWTAWVGEGRSAGSAAKNKELTGIAVKADAGQTSGGVSYSVYNSHLGWMAEKSNGACTGKAARHIEAIRIALTGEMGEKYDVYYRVYSQNVGWLDWAANGGIAGNTEYGEPLGAYQVKLVAKGGQAPGSTEYPTIESMETSATMDGIDISSHQRGIDVASVSANFIVIKATGGTDYVNPFYREWADKALASGKQIGFYHFAREAYCPGSAVDEANHFVNAVGPYIGQAVLALDFEADALSMANCVTWAKKFLDTVYRKTGVRPLIYLSQSVTHEFNWTKVANKYKLWVAQYLYRNFYTGYIAPEGGTDIWYWQSPQMYQYSSTGRINYAGDLDLNRFYGSVRTWKQLASKS